MNYKELNDFFQSQDSVERADLVRDETANQDGVSIDHIPLPKYISHCTGHYYPKKVPKVLGSILKNRELNSKDPYTFLSPLPNYNHCVVFPTETFEHNPVPTYYCHDIFKDKDEQQYCVVFSEKGWTKVDITDFPKDKIRLIKRQRERNLDQIKTTDDYRIANTYLREREWRIKNPAGFSLDDITALTVQNCNTDLVHRLYPAFAEADLSLSDINVLKDKIIQFEKKGLRDNNGHFYKSDISPIKRCTAIPTTPADKLIYCSSKFFKHAELLTEGESSYLTDPKHRSEFETCKILDKDGVMIENYDASQ